MRSTLTSQETLHGIGVSQLLRAPALSLSTPQGMRQGGGTRGTIRSAAHFPSKAALELGRKFEFARGVGDRNTIDNTALERHHGRCGREFRGQRTQVFNIKAHGSVLMWKGPAALNLKPCRKASEQAPVVVRGKLALPDRSVKADSHLASSALRPLQGECDRDRGALRCLFQTNRMSEREGT